MLTIEALLTIDCCACGAVIGWEEEDLGACRECGAPVEAVDGEATEATEEARETVRKPNPFARCADFSGDADLMVAAVFDGFLGLAEVPPPPPAEGSLWRLADKETGATVVRVAGLRESDAGTEVLCEVLTCIGGDLVADFPLTLAKWRTKPLVEVML